VVVLMKQEVKILLFSGFLMLLLIPILSGCKKSLPETNSATPRIGILDLAKTINAHPRYNEMQKIEQEIAKIQAEAAHSTEKAVADTSMPGQGNAEYQQALDQQINAQLAHKRNELAQALESNVAAIKQETSQQLAGYAKELDKTYQPEILSLQLKMQTVQMTQEERDEAKKQLNALQEQRMQKLQKQQELLEQDLRPRIEQEQMRAEEQFRQFHSQLLQEASSHMSEQQKVMETQRMETAARLSTPAGESGSSTELQVLLEQREKLRQIIMKEIKEATARIAAKENLEVVIVNYNQNIQAMDITSAVIAEFKK
jgi:Skp family chaperone for outer membrane proteins